MIIKQVYLSENTHRKLSLIAKNEKTSISALIREGLVELVNRSKNKKTLVKSIN